MSGIEQTLLQTLAKGDANDAEFRKRVYNAAANALRRSLEAQSNLTVDSAQVQKDKLADAIRSVEQRFQAPVSPVVTPSADRLMPTQDRVKPEPPSRAPQLRAKPRPIEPVLRAEANFSAEKPRMKAERPDVEKPGGTGPLRLKRGPFAASFGTIALVGLLLLGLIWVMVSGAFQDPAARDTSVPNPPPETGSDSFEPRDPGTSTAPALRSQQEDTGDWITIFSTDDVDNLRLQGGAVAGAASDPFGPFVLISTPPGSSATITIPPGPLQSLLGQRAQVEITAKTSDGQTTQMAVQCNLGPNIDCVRTRFVVGQSPEAFTYRIDMTNVRRLQGEGSLVINSDMSGDGKEVKLISVRVRAEEAA